MPILQSKGLTAATKEAKGLLEDMISTAKAENRDLTSVETVRAETIMRELDVRKDIAAKAAHANSPLERLKGVPVECTMAESLAAMEASEAAERTSRGAKSSGYGTLQLRAKAAEMARAVTDRANTRGGGVKGLQDAGGVMNMPVQVVNAPIPQGRAATTLLDLLPAEQLRGTTTATWVEETGRDLQAKPWKRGTDKALSTITVGRKSAELEVVAHIVDGINVYDLNDSDSLGQFISDEMVYGLNQAVEQQVLHGTGTSPELRGILTTSGIKQQAYTTSPLVTVRHALAQLEKQGIPAQAIVMAVDDWLAIETATLSSGAFMLSQGTSGAPLDSVERRLWGTRVALSSVVEPGQAVVIGEGAVRLFFDQGAMLAVDPYTGFQRNELRVRAEIRAQVGTLVPSGVVVADLAA